jgi:hypothetical protein
VDGLSVGLPWPVVAWLVAGALVLAGAVAVDARERDQSAPLWFILTLVFPLFGALAYLVLRAPRAATTRSAAPVARESAAPTARGGATAAAEESAVAPSPGPAAASSAGHSGPAEWRRDVGVLPASGRVENLGVSAVPPRHSSRSQRRLPPWLLGAFLALVVLVAGGGFLLSRVVPSLGTPAATPTVVPAPTAAPQAAVEAPAAEAGAEPTRESTMYTVEPGDSLGSIAEQFNTTVDALLEANNFDNPDLLVVGQRIIVPQ